MLESIPIDMQAVSVTLKDKVKDSLYVSRLFLTLISRVALTGDDPLAAGFCKPCYSFRRV